VDATPSDRQWVSLKIAGRRFQKAMKAVVSVPKSKLLRPKRKRADKKQQTAKL
jgi:hypothetical protein